MRQSPYASGWVDSSIHDFILGISEFPAGMTYALITSLDSTLEPAKLLAKSPALQAVAKKATHVGDGFLIPSRMLLAETQTRIFFGFDEVWFFDHRDISEKPAALTLVGPRKATETMLEPHLSWLTSNGCTLGMGDGAGLNYCARVRGVARLLLDAFQDPVTA